MAFGLNTDTTWIRSNMGLSIASVWDMKCVTNETAKMEEEDEMFARATQTTPEDVGKSLGKPGQSPKSITELLEAIECYIIHFEAFLEDKGQHQKHVRQLRGVLQEKYSNGSLAQSQLDDIYWSVFWDSRQYFKWTEGKPTSGSDALVGALARDQMSSFVGIQYHRLSPQSDDSKHQKISNGAYAPERCGGGGGNRVQERERANGSEKVKHHHKLLKAQWETTRNTIGPKYLVKNIITEVKQLNGTPWSIKSLSSIVNDNGCIIGVITSKCDRPHCGFDHTIKLKDTIAETLCGIVKAGTKVIEHQK